MPEYFLIEELSIDPKCHGQSHIILQHFSIPLGLEVSSHQQHSCTDIYLNNVGTK